MPWYRSIEDLGAISMVEPSFLHLGTLSALPDTWKSFSDAVVESEQQVSGYEGACVNMP